MHQEVTKDELYGLLEYLDMYSHDTIDIGRKELARIIEFAIKLMNEREKNENTVR